MQTVQEPDKITVPADNLACAALGGNFVVVVLEHEDTFFLGHEGYQDCFFKGGTCAAGYCSLWGVGIGISGGMVV